MRTVLLSLLSFFCFLSALPAQMERVFDSTYALPHVYTALSHANATGDSLLAARASYALGQYYLRVDKEQKRAFQYLFRSRQLFQQAGDTTGLHFTNKVIAAYYADNFDRIEKERERYNIEQERQKSRFVTLLIVFFFVVVISGIVMVVYNQRYHDQQTIAQQLEEINRQKIDALENTLHTETLHAMLSGQEAERQRVSKDLHDGLGGLLASIKYKIEALLPLAPFKKDVSDVIQ